MPLSRFLHSLVSIILSGPLFAASIQWDAPRNILGPADVSTEGAYFGAWSPANSTIPVGKVNGVQMRGDDLELTTSGFDGAAFAFGTHTTSDDNYNTLLQYGTWSNSTSASFTINGTGRRPLTPGRQYLVQMWVSDARSYGLSRTESVSGSGTLVFQTSNGMGQYVIGRFTANAASQTITLSANQSAQVNLVQVRDITPPEPETRQQRWKRLKYGIFSHYTYAMTGDANTAGERFNAEAYADDLEQAGAEYVVWTAWHSNTIPMFPSKAMDKYGFGGRYSQRDTVSDMIDAVRARGIRVFLYVHPFQPIGPRELWNDFVNELFAEVMDRYGPRIDGLWIDENQINGDQDSVVDYKRLMQTIKSRNPDMVTMQNGGQMYTVDLGGPETVNDWNFARWQCMYNLVAPWIGITAEDMLRTTVLNAAANYDGGGIHWSIDGVVDGGLAETGRIFQLAQYLAPIRASICGTKPSASFPPPFTGEQLRYSNVNQYVATEALDDSKVYIHVLKPPAGTLLALPNPVDGKIFSSARLLASGNHVGLLQDPYDGVRLRLQGSDTWDPLNTVIELTVASKGGSGHVNDTSGSITYTGSSWSYQENRGNGEFANDVHLATADGDSFTFTFSGTDVQYIATRGTDRGQVEIYIDDALETTVDLSTGTPGSRQVAFSKSGLARGMHTLKGIKRSGTLMEVDCFKVTDLINDSDPEMNGAYLSTTDYGTGAAGYAGPSNWWQPGYNGANWITPAVNYYPNNEPLNDPANNEPMSDYFEFTFTGTGVQIPLSSAHSLAYFYMKVDGVFHSNVQVQQGQVSMFSVSGLAPGSHTVRGITWKATSDPSQPGVNGFKVTRPDIWTAASNRGYGELGDDVHYTDLNPGRFSWNFDGSGVEVITTRDSDSRMAWFGVSGPGTSISARLQNYSSQRQVGTTVFSLPYLPPGTHNLSVTHGANMSGLNFSFARLAIDGVRVYKGQALAAPSLRWGASGGGGSGTWDNNSTANWFNGSSAVKWPAAGGTRDVATFGGTVGTVSLSGTVTANRLQFDTNGYVLQNGTLNLNGNSPVIRTASGVSTSISSTVAGGSGLVKNGAGTLVMSGSNIYTGQTTVNEGTLSVTTAATGSASHFVANAATLQVRRAAADGTLVVADLIAENGSSLILDVQSFGLSTASAVIETTGTLATAGTVTLNIAGDVLSIGRKPLLKYAALGGDGFGAFVLGSLPNGVVATLVHNLSNKSIDLNVLGVPDWLVGATELRYLFDSSHMWTAVTTDASGNNRVMISGGGSNHWNGGGMAPGSSASSIIADNNAAYALANASGMPADNYQLSIYASRNEQNWPYSHGEMTILSYDGVRLAVDAGGNFIAQVHGSMIGSFYEASGVAGLMIRKTNGVISFWRAPANTADWTQVGSTSAAAAGSDFSSLHLFIQPGGGFNYWGYIDDFKVERLLPRALLWNNAADTMAWNTTDANWTGSAWSNSGPRDAIFSSTGAGVVTLLDTITVRDILFDAADYTITGGALSLAGSTIVVNAPATIASDLTGSSGLIKDGDATLSLTGTNTYTGPTSVIAGKLQIKGSVGSDVTVQANGVLSPGASIGTLNIPAALIGGTLAIEVNETFADRLNVTGDLNITHATLAISGTPTADEYLIASYGSLTGSSFVAVTGLPDEYEVDYSNNQIRLVARTPSFAFWIENNWPALSDKSPAADPDNDGMANAIEYALGGNPSLPDPGLAPRVTTNEGDLLFSFLRTDDAEAAEITLMVEAGNDLKTWPDAYLISPGVASPSVSIVENGLAPDTITVTIPQGTAGVRFARLRVTLPP